MNYFGFTHERWLLGDCRIVMGTSEGLSVNRTGRERREEFEREGGG
jgi:hypothetical protein